MKKFKTELSAFLAGAMIALPLVSCEKKTIDPVSEVTTSVVETITDQQQEFLDNFDNLIAVEIKEIEKVSTREKGGQTVNPENLNNPFDYVGKKTYDVVKSAIPDPAATQNEILTNGTASLKANIISSSELLTNQTVDLTTFDELSTYTSEDATTLFENNNLSPFAKKLAKRYIERYMNQNTLIGQINYSKAFENLLTKGNGPEFVEKDAMLQGVAMQKYVMSAIFEGAEPGNEPLNGPISGCALAIMGMAFATYGLVTLTAASGGLATGVAVVGFVVASASLGDSCGSAHN